MAAKRVFIAFDYDHDEDLRNLLAGQAKHPDTPFEDLQLVGEASHLPPTGRRMSGSGFSKRISRS